MNSSTRSSKHADADPHGERPSTRMPDACRQCENDTRKHGWKAHRRITRTPPDTRLIAETRGSKEKIRIRFLSLRQPTAVRVLPLSCTHRISPCFCACTASRRCTDRWAGISMRSDTRWEHQFDTRSLVPPSCATKFVRPHPNRFSCPQSRRSQSVAISSGDCEKYSQKSSGLACMS